MKCLLSKETDTVQLYFATLIFHEAYIYKRNFEKRLTYKTILAYRNSWTLDATVGHWTLDTVPWTLDSGRWTLYTGLWTLESGRWILDTRLWTLNARLWKLKL